MAGGDEMTALQQLGLQIELVANWVNTARDLYLKALQEQLESAVVPTPIVRLRFDSPVGTVQERASAQIWPGKWIDAMGYNTTYPASMKRNDIHTGNDLNLNFPQWNADANAPCYAVAIGTVVFADLKPVWGKIVVIKHTLEDGSNVWSRYAHLETFAVAVGQVVNRGAQVGTIGNAEGKQAWHLHFDLAKIDLGARPDDWPNTDRARLLRDYIDPFEFIKSRHLEG